jgi:hypothetical protein
MFTMTDREIAQNFMDAIHFNHPRWIPCQARFLPATWIKYREQLENIVLKYPKLFYKYKKGMKNFDFIGPPSYHRGEVTDNWGCLWRNNSPGLEGICVKGPLENWDNFDSWTSPDPFKKEGMFGDRQNWDMTRNWFSDMKKQIGVADCGLYHGMMFMRLYYLRGFENLLIDMTLDEPKLPKLIEKVLSYNTTVIKKYLEAGANFLILAEDLGTQNSLPVNPVKWREYIKPCYIRMCEPFKKCNFDIFLHSDGHILEIVDDLYEAGITIINPQVEANTLDGIVKHMKGRFCLYQDLNRQMFPFASPRDVREHILEVHNKLKDNKGGLCLVAEVAPDVPLDNIDMICNTLSEIGGPDLWYKSVWG